MMHGRKCLLHVGMHKTGSSSIQESLNRTPTSKAFHYVKLSSPNHSGDIYTLFSQHPEQYHAWKKQALSPEEVNAKRDEIQSRLIQNFTESDAEVFLISGEDIAELSEVELLEMKTFLLRYFESIEVFAYVRSPKSYIESAFQQTIKGYLDTFSLDKMYPRYQKRFEKFDNVFGRENVQLYLYDLELLLQQDVVTDFCLRAGIAIDAGGITRTNDSLSREAVSLLYTYRKFGPGYGSGKHVMRENNMMIAQLSKIGDTKFKFSDELIKPVLLQNSEDIRWIEARLGREFSNHERRYAHAIHSEEELLEIDAQSVAMLKKLLGDEYLPTGLEGQSRREIALLVHLLRLKENDLFEGRRYDLIYKSTDFEPQVIKGRNGFLFLSGEGDQTLKYFTGESKPTDASVGAFFDNIEARQKFCDSQEIKYKHFIFADKLYSLRNNIELPISSLFKTAYAPRQYLENLHYMEFDPETAAKYYYKTDTRLNVYGVLETVKAIIGNEHDFESVLSAIEASYEVKVGFTGDLGMRYQEACYEAIVSLGAPSTTVREHNGVDPGKDGIMDIVLNSDALYDEKVLIFGDTFFRSLLNVLAYFFKEIIYCRTPYVHTDMINLLKVDRMYSGITERGLFNVKGDGEAGDFFTLLQKQQTSISSDEHFMIAFKLLTGHDYNTLLLEKYDG